ncbi:hypothetical protein G6L37_00095 [Agrobacterium rubi]|nr:hypothetical protein [Agrobacterium rubi]NTF23650.1 hypothetical protein [Agrobacterium rubi]
MPNLMFIEPAAGEWFYLQEEPGSPSDSWDWTEYSQAYGPFPTYEAACDDQYANRPRTSGSEVWENGDPQMTYALTDTVKEKIAEIGSASPSPRWYRA